ncbi:uncharacterized protein METZ01_LOCUS378053, partial [marine metagenome]
MQVTADPKPLIDREARPNSFKTSHIDSFLDLTGLYKSPETLTSASGYPSFFHVVPYGKCSNNPDRQ